MAAGLAPRFAVFFCDALPGAGAACPAWRALPAPLLLVAAARDGLVLCVDCGHWRPGRCRNHMAAGLAGFELAAGWHELPQRCADFRRAPRPEGVPMHGHATTDAPGADFWAARGIVEGGWK